MEWENLIGVPTTLRMAGDAGSEAKAIPGIIGQVEEFAFKAIEIVPAQFTPVSGKDAAAFLQNTFGAEERIKLKERLKSFPLVTVHGSNITVNVSERAPGREAELWEPYVELMRFARDIGARVVTFHSLRQGERAGLAEAEMADYHVRFGKIAAGLAQDWDLFAGFELATTFEFFLRNKILDKIGSGRFGALLDVGHIALPFAESSDITAAVIQVMEQCMDHALEVHGGGVQKSSNGLREHRPLDRRNTLDHGRILGMLQRKKFQGPMIFEIFYQTAVSEQIVASLTENLNRCREAKDFLISGTRSPGSLDSR